MRIRTLYFTQMTDDRFDRNIKSLLEERVREIKKLLNVDGVKVVVSDIEDIHFDEHTKYREDGSIVYKTEPHNQCKCTFQIIKTTRKLTWNDIYKIVNSVKPAPYSFNGFLS